MKTLVTFDNRILVLWRSIASGIVLVATACSSGGGAAPERAAPATAPSLPAPESGHYAFVGGSTDGVHYGDTQSGRDSVLFGTSGSVTAWAASPRGRYVVVAHSEADSMIVSLIALADGAVRRLHSVAPSAELSIVWAPDGGRLAFGVRAPGASAGVFIADTSGQVRSAGCSAANRVEAFRGSDQLIVSDRANFYAVAASGCRTLATFPGSGKSEVRYAPNGNYVTFMRGHQTTGRPELWLAEYNGNRARVIASYNFRPADVRWSPRGDKLALTVQSQQYRNVTHLATYDIQSGDVQVGREETPLGVPRDFDPCWSPDGSRYAFSRSYQRTGADGQSYETRQAVVRTVGSDGSRVVSEDLVRNATDTGGSCQWAGDTHLLVRSPAGHKVVDVTTNTAYELPAWQEVFGVLVR